MKNVNVNLILDELDRLLIDVYKNVSKNKKIGVLFSGGVDSSTIAKYALDLGLHPQLYTFGTEFSKDYEYAKKLADFLHLKLHYLALTRNDINRCIPPVKNLLVKNNIDPNLMQVSLAIGFMEIGKFAKNNGISLFLSGQGSDELFAGYNKYLKLNPAELNLQMQKDARNLFLVDVKRDCAMTKTSGIDIFFPYLNSDFVTYCQNIPLALKIKDCERKWILRRLAEKRGLPDYIFQRPKNALQYSSGIQKIARKLFIPHRS